MSRPVLFFGAVLLLSAPLFASPERAPLLSPIPVYVMDVDVEKGVTADAHHLTSAICTALAKDKRLEVLCAPDVQQLLQFSGQLAMFGGESDAAEKVAKQLLRVRFVVKGQLSRGEGGLVLRLGLHEKAKESDGLHVIPGERRALLTEKLEPGQTAKILDRAPALATRLATHAYAASDPPPPPPVLEKE